VVRGSTFAIGIAGEVTDAPGHPVAADYAARVAPKLNPGEQVIFEGHPSWRSILGFYIKGLLVTAAIALVVGLVTGIAGDEVDTGLVTIVAVIGVAITVLVGFIKRIATDYVITDRRLHIKRGIISRTIQETRLVRVQNVNYNQGVLDRILQIGDVDFDTAAGDDYNFVFSGVAQPEEVVHQVDRATRLAGDDGMGTEQGREPAPR
jgi:uncharacterized membrane protein YdbT with pleckstrin-like domain